MLLPALVVAALVSGCIPPSPGVIYIEFCIAYGPQASEVERQPNGAMVEKKDGESTEAIKETLRACRD